MENGKHHRISIKLNGEALSGGRAENHRDRKQHDPFSEEAEQAGAAAFTREAKGEEDETGGDPLPEDASWRLLQLRSADSVKQEEHPVVHHLEDDAINPKESGWRRKFVSTLRPFFFSPHRQTGRMVVAAVSAVLLGLGFGYLVMNVFSAEELARSYQTVIGGTLQTLTTGQMDAPAERQEEQTETGGPETSYEVHHPEQRFFMAQVGVFRDAASAQPVIEKLQKQGFPHFLYQQEGRQHLLAAIASTRDEVLGLASHLKANRFDVYIREVTFPAQRKTLGSGSAKELQAAAPHPAQNGEPEAFFQTANELVNGLSAWSSQVINADSQEKMPPPQEIATLQELHRRMLEEGKQLQSLVSGADRELLNAMMNGITRSVTAVREAKAANAPSYAWQVQSGVLSYLQNYSSWLNNSNEAKPTSM